MRAQMHLMKAAPAMYADGGPPELVVMMREERRRNLSTYTFCALHSLTTDSIVKLCRAKNAGKSSSNEESRHPGA
jgi:hypothetical protein